MPKKHGYIRKLTFKPWLQIIGKHPNGRCDKCQVEETMSHVILECNEYEQERIGMIEEVKKDGVQEIYFEFLIKWASEINS